MNSIIARDQLVDNLLDRIDELERRIANLEANHPGRPGTRAGTLAYFDQGGALRANMVTETLAVVDAGSSGATEQGWIAVAVGGVTGYVRVFAGK